MNEQQFILTQIFFAIFLSLGFFAGYHVGDFVGWKKGFNYRGNLIKNKETTK